MSRRSADASRRFRVDKNQTSAVKHMPAPKADIASGRTKNLRNADLGPVWLGRMISLYLARCRPTSLTRPQMLGLRCWTSVATELRTGRCRNSEQCVHF